MYLRSSRNCITWLAFSRQLPIVIWFSESVPARAGVDRETRIHLLQFALSGLTDGIGIAVKLGVFPERSPNLSFQSQKITENTFYRSS